MFPPDRQNSVTPIAYFITLGGKTMSTVPAGPQSAADIFHRLKCAAGHNDAHLAPIGNRYEEYVAYDRESLEQNFIIG